MTFTYRYRKQLLIGGILCFLIVCGITSCILFLPKPKVKEKQVFKVAKKETKDKKEVEVRTLKIDIKGEVMNPGIYTLKIDSRVMDAIAEAGGLTENADTSVLNLSKKIEDEMVIIVYSYQEVRNFKETKEIEKSVQESCRKGGDYELTNNACIEEKEENSLSGKISINSATLEQLQLLPGIGESKAKAIIDYREQNGPFTSIEDLQKVPGIGESIFAQIKENITT